MFIISQTMEKLLSIPREYWESTIAKYVVVFLVSFWIVIIFLSIFIGILSENLHISHLLVWNSNYHLFSFAFHK